MNKILLAFLFVLLPITGFSQNRYVKKIAAYTKGYAAAYNFNGAILVAKKNKVIFQIAFGDANKEWSIANTIETRFPISSLTKQFTAAAILQLEEEGKLSVNDKLSKFFPDYPKGDSITLHMLLNHTSGIKEFSQYPELFKTINISEVSRDSIVNIFKKMPLNFSPGTFWGYNNTGYILLGYIIEHVSGQSYGEYINKNIFQKAGMLNSGIFYPHSLIKYRADGYTQTTNGLMKHTVIPFNLGYSDGGIFSTINDLFTWIKALNSCKIISQESLSKMNEPNLKDRGAGYGIFIDKSFDRKIRFHTGNIPGYSSSMITYPDDEINIIILANRETNLDFLPKGIAAIMFDKEVITPYSHKPVEIKPGNLKRYVAKFQAPYPFEVTERNGKLFMSFGRDIELVPESETKFFVIESEADIQIEYVFNKKNEIDHVFLIEGGVKTEAKLK